jgi:hypothetical protein
MRRQSHPNSLRDPRLPIAVQVKLKVLLGDLKHGPNRHSGPSGQKIKRKHPQKRLLSMPETANIILGGNEIRVSGPSVSKLSEQLQLNRTPALRDILGTPDKL